VARSSGEDGGPPDTGPKLDMDGHPLIQRSSARSASLRVVPSMMPGWTGLLSAFRGGGFPGPPADPPRARSIARPGRAAAASLTAALRRRRRTDHPDEPRHRRCRQAERPRRSKADIAPSQSPSSLDPRAPAAFSPVTERRVWRLERPQLGSFSEPGHESWHSLGRVVGI